MNLFTGIEFDPCFLPSLGLNGGCTSAKMWRSEISGAYIVPNRAGMPSDWLTAPGWDGVINNEGLTLDSGRYLVGIGEFVPLEFDPAILAGGRAEVNLPRKWQLNLTVRDLSESHLALADKMARGWHEFRFWLETIDGRLIGGPTGLGAFTAVAAPRWASGLASKEVLEISVTCWLPGIPKIGPMPEISLFPLDLDGCDDAYLSIDGDIYTTVGNQCYLLN